MTKRVPKKVGKLSTAEKALRSIRLRANYEAILCACGNYYTSPRSADGKRCDLGHNWR